MKVDADGLEFIRTWEGCELEPYKDQAGYLTVGVGHLLSGEDDPWNRTITIEEADYLLASDVEPPEDVINDNVKVEINQNHFNAMASLAFNIGTGAFKDSTLLRVLNEGDYAEAADQFLVWNKITVDGEKVVSQGLANRREAERERFLTADVAVPPTDYSERVVERTVHIGEAGDLVIQLWHFNALKTEKVDRDFLGELLDLIDEYESGDRTG